MSPAIAPGIAAAGAPRAADEPGWVEAVLGFWLRERGDAQWFAKDPAQDALVGARFGALQARLADEPGFAPRSPREALAAVIVLDQFSRNLFRDDPRAFACDPAARRIAAAALDAGWDAGMSAAESLFLALPFEHSESLADQARAVALTGALGNPDWSRFARAHYDIVASFGRFPHRNAALGRPNTAQEQAFLAGPGSAF
jgi:uncharacterized protein (DUF924 family)